MFEAVLLLVFWWFPGFLATIWAFKKYNSDCEFNIAFTSSIVLGLFGWASVITTVLMAVTRKWFTSEKS